MKTINLDGVVGWDIEASEFASILDNTTGDITFELNSGGGYVTDGISILNKIRAYDRGKTTANISYAASMMTQIALACDEVNVYDNAIFMIHNVQGIVVGDHNDMREAADLQERMSMMLAQLYCKKTKKSENEIKTMMDNDTYLFGTEIKDMGFADNIIDTEKSKDKTNAIDTAHTMYKKVQKAMKEEKLSVSALKEQFKLCVGNCSLATMPSDNEKIANSNLGASMEFNIENFNLLVEQTKVLKANKETMSARNETLTMQLEEATTALDTTKAELSQKTEKLNGMEAQLSEAIAKTADAETRVREAITLKVDADTAVKMLVADTAESASALANAFRGSNGASGKADGNVTSQEDPWANMNFKR